MTAATAVVGDMITCAFTTDYLGNTLEQLEPMSTELLGLIVEAL
ncbi:MAG TPA: hypothetical protein VIP77_20460 [Jiangellaceae bacterium]